MLDEDDGLIDPGDLTFYQVQRICVRQNRDCSICPLGPNKQFTGFCGLMDSPCPADAPFDEFKKIKKSEFL